MQINKKYTLIAALISLTSMNYGVGEPDGSFFKDDTFGFRRSTESSRPTMPEYEEQQRAAELRAKDLELENQKRFANRTTLHYSPKIDGNSIRIDRPQDTRTTWKKVKDFFNDLFFDGRTAKKSIDSYTRKVLRGDSETVLNEQEKEAFSRLSDKAQLKYINRFTDSINDARQKELKSDSQALVAQQTTLETAQKQFLSDQSEARAQIVKNIKDSLNSIAPKGSNLRNTDEYKKLTQSILDKKTNLSDIQTTLNDFAKVLPSNDKTSLNLLLLKTNTEITRLNDLSEGINQLGHKYNLERREHKIEIEKKYNDKLEKFYTDLNNTVFRTGKQIIYNTDTGKAEFYTPESDTYQFNETLANRPEDTPKNEPISSEPTSPNASNNEERHAVLIENFMKIVNDSSKSKQLRLNAINTLKKPDYWKLLKPSERARINEVFQELDNSRSTTETPYALGTTPQPVRQTTETDFTESNTSTATYPTYRPKANFDETFAGFQKDNVQSPTNIQTAAPITEVTTNAPKTELTEQQKTISTNLFYLTNPNKHFVTNALSYLSENFDKLSNNEQKLFETTLNDLLKNQEELTEEDVQKLDSVKKKFDSVQEKLDSAKKIAV
ncbi:hypothetical protein KBD08_01970 [Candidatus Babeliales bacterium]|nr:hypothetical protein [Candidatus Babeliales bacterium]